MKIRANSIYIYSNDRQKQWEALGKHIILEIFTDKKEELNKRDFIKNLLCEAAKKAETTILDYADHQFQPQGITATLLLAESHISIHTWPEFGYAAIDIYTCGGDPDKAVEYIIEQLNPHHVKKVVLFRGKEEEIKRFGHFDN